MPFGALGGALGAQGALAAPAAVHSAGDDDEDRRGVHPGGCASDHMPLESVQGHVSCITSIYSISIIYTLIVLGLSFKGLYGNGLCLHAGDLWDALAGGAWSRFVCLALMLAPWKSHEGCASKTSYPQILCLRRGAVYFLRFL